MVLLSAIVIGKTNPRKSFDEDAIQELAQSIKHKGVIQPILLRPVGDSLELVCGERRYRASMIAGLTEIPAYVRTLTDDEALEAQITENLQRKDVHPMDEAFAFKQMLEKHNIEETAALLGKKNYFINQRMKLNDLLPEWQKLFYNNFFNLSMALKIAVLPVATQKEMLKDSGVNNKNVENTQSLSINNYKLQQYSGSLNKATFDLSDATLDKKAGACNNCQFNSAVANLFPESVTLPICSNISCFKHKVDINFDRELRKALEDPAVVFITTDYHLHDSDIANQLKTEKQTILTRYDYNEVGIQEADIEGFTEWKDRMDDETPDDELKKDYDEYVSNLNKQKEATQKKLATGKYLKAFIISGTGKGLYKYIEIKKAKPKDDKKSAKDRIESGKATAADIDSEIGRIRDREKRSKELDGEKVHKLIVDTMKEDKVLKTPPKEFTGVDRVLMCFLIAEYVDYSSRDIVKKVIGFNSGTWGNEKGDKYYKQLEGLTDEQLAFLVRTIIFQKYNSNLPTGNGGYMVRKLAELIGTIPIADFEADQKVRADKRQKNVDKRIAELQEQKKELKPKPEPKAPAKKAEKSASKKKATA